MHSFIGRDSAAGLRSVVKQHQTENYSICEQLAALGSAQPGSASPGPERDPCCGLVWQRPSSRTELAPGRHGSAKALPRAAPLSASLPS